MRCRLAGDSVGDNSITAVMGYAYLRDWAGDGRNPFNAGTGTSKTRRIGCPLRSSLAPRAGERSSRMGLPLRTSAGRSRVLPNMSQRQLRPAQRCRRPRPAVYWASLCRRGGRGPGGLWGATCGDSRGRAHAGDRLRDRDRTKADGAINFTASHNPPECNGIKFSTPDGAPALPETTSKIESLNSGAYVRKLT